MRPKVAFTEYERVFWEEEAKRLADPSLKLKKSQLPPSPSSADSSSVNNPNPFSVENLNVRRNLARNLPVNSKNSFHNLNSQSPVRTNPSSPSAPLKPASLIAPPFGTASIACPHLLFTTPISARHPASGFASFARPPPLQNASYSAQASASPIVNNLLQAFTSPSAIPAPPSASSFRFTEADNAQLAFASIDTSRDTLLSTAPCAKPSTHTAASSATTLSDVTASPPECGHQQNLDLSRPFSTRLPASDQPLSNPTALPVIPQAVVSQEIAMASSSQPESSLQVVSKMTTHKDDNRSGASTRKMTEVIGSPKHELYSNTTFPQLIHDQLFPLPTMTSNALLLSNPLIPHGPPKIFKSWPKPPEEWGNWVDRLHPHFGEQWRAQGLWHLIMVSKSRISIQSALIETLLRFWAPPCNSFIFPLGPMSITLYDIMMLTGLPILGLDSLYLIDDKDAPVLAAPCYSYPSYAAVTKQWSASTGDPSPIEHIMFLWVVICHYIFCRASGKPLSEYLPLACSLSTGKRYNLGAMLLGSLYHGLNKTVAEEPISKLGGVSWFLQVWAFAYFPRLRDFPVGPPTIMRTTSLMGSTTSLSAHELLAFFQTLSACDVQFPSRPSPNSVLQAHWVDRHPSLQGKSSEDLVNYILTSCIHHRFLIVGRCAVKDKAMKDKANWLFEFYNPSLVARQFGMAQTIPHSTLYFPVDLSFISTEVGEKKLSKATIELLAVFPDRFLNPVAEMDMYISDQFGLWWKSRYSDLVHGLPSSPENRKRPRMKSPLTPKPACTNVKGKMKGSSPSKIKKTKVQMVHKRYRTRGSSRLTSRFTNTTSDPIRIDESVPTDTDLEAPEEYLDDESAEEAEESEDSGEETATEHSGSGKQLASADDHGESALHTTDRSIHVSRSQSLTETIHPSPELDLASRRARFRQIGGQKPIAVDLSFADNTVSSGSGLDFCTLSIESFVHARTALHNFLDFGPLQLGQSQRLSMLSSIAILQAYPEFSTSEYNQLLSELPGVFSQSDAAHDISTEMVTHFNHFKTERKEKETLDVEDETICVDIAKVTAAYDAEEMELRRLNEAARQCKARMNAHLDTAEGLEVKLGDVRRKSQVLTQKLVGLKDEYQMWVKQLQEAEKMQSECQAKWERLRQLDKSYSSQPSQTPDKPINPGAH